MISQRINKGRNPVLALNIKAPNLKIRIVFIFVILSILSACGTSPLAGSTAIPQTLTAAPIYTPSFTPENMAYISAIEIKIKVWLSVYTQFNSFHQKANDKKKIFTNENWKTMMSGALDDLAAASDDVINVKPVPPAMQNINSNLIQAIDETRLMIAAYRVMLKDNDKSQLDQIYVFSENALKFMKLATDEMEPYLK